MFESQILIAGDSDGDSQMVYSPWFPRQGDYLLATVEVVQLTSAVTLETKVFTKNSEDTGDGTDVDAGTSISQSASGRADEEWGPQSGRD